MALIKSETFDQITPSAPPSKLRVLNSLFEPNNLTLCLVQHILHKFQQNQHKIILATTTKQQSAIKST